MDFDPKYRPIPAPTNTPPVYPFGSVIPEFSYKNVAENDTAGYRYGFNNQEQDGELGEFYAFEFRVHDAKLGRFLSVDPLADSYPWYAPYQFAGNTPIQAIDLEGLEPKIVNSSSNDDGSTVLSLEDKTSGYKSSVTLDGEKGDHTIADGDLITGYVKDNVTYIWNEQYGYYSSGNIKTFSNATITTTTYTSFIEKFRSMEYEWSSPNGRYTGMWSGVFRTFVDFSPQASIGNIVTGVFRGEDIWGGEQNAIQTTSELILLSFPIIKAGRAYLYTIAKVSSKIANQMVKRGWSKNLIYETLNNSFTKRVSKNKETGNPATVFYNKDGSYIVQDDVTKEIIQISNRNTSQWFPDPEIIDPYIP